jgi:hypothetical protein
VLRGGVVAVVVLRGGGAVGIACAARRCGGDRLGCGAVWWGSLVLRGGVAVVAVLRGGVVGIACAARRCGGDAPPQTPR